MNNFLRNFIMKTIRKMVDNVPEWEVREFAIGWYSKGVLTESDLQEIDELYTVPEELEEEIGNDELNETEEEGE